MTPAFQAWSQCLLWLFSAVGLYVLASELGTRTQRRLMRATATATLLMLVFAGYGGWSDMLSLPTCSADLPYWLELWIGCIW